MSFKGDDDRPNAKFLTEVYSNKNKRDIPLTMNGNRILFSIFLMQNVSKELARSQNLDISSGITHYLTMLCLFFSFSCN